MPSTGLDPGLVRERFPALAGSAALFDGPGGSQAPTEVIEAVSGYLATSNANLGGAFRSSMESDLVLERARSAAADFTGSEPEEIAFGANMTTLNFLLAHAVARTLEPGDEIVVTDLDHDANVSPWLLVAEDHDLVVRHAPIRTGDGTLDEDALEALAGRAHARGGVHARLERPRLDHGRRADRSRGRERRGARVGRRRAPGAAPPAAAPRAGHPRAALLSVQVLRAPPGRGRDRAGAGRVAAGGPGAPGRRMAARPPVRDRHPVPRGDRRHDGRDRIPPLARGWQPGHRVRADPGPRGGAVAPLPRGGPGRARSRAVRDRRSRARGERTPTFCFNLAGWEPRRLAASSAAREIYVWDGNYYALAPMRSLGLSERGAVRAGFLHYTTEDEVDRLLAALPISRVGHSTRARRPG